MSDIILGVTLIVLAIFVLIFSSSFPELIVRGEKLPGPRYFPSLLSILMILFGTFYIVSNILKFRKTEKNQEEASKRQVLPSLVVLASSILFVPVIQLIGTTAGVIVITFSMMVFFRVKWYYSAVISVMLALLIKVVFEVLFKVPLPEGTLLPL